MDAGNLLAVVGERKGERKLGDALRLLTGDDLERLDDAVDRLVLETRVFTLGVLTDDAEVDVLVARLVTGDVLEEDDGGVDVELLTESNVEGTVAGALDGRVEDTLETELVALERSNGLAEELLGVDVARVDTRDVDLLPLNGHVVRLEDLLDRLGDLSTDTVTCACSESMSNYRRLSRIPGIRVTVYLPPNLVGLKMSWVTVAIAVAALDSAFLDIFHVVFVQRVAMAGAHREAGFAPRRSVCTGALALEFPPRPPIAGASSCSYLRCSLGGPRQHGGVAALGWW